MKDKYRRISAEICAMKMLGVLDYNGSYPELVALLAEYDELKRENERLRAENEELQQKVFRLNEDLPGEEWRDVKGYEGLYQVSNLGRIKSFHRGICIIRVPKVYGDRRYAEICLSKNGKCVNYLVHRLVAQAFVLNLDPATKTEVHHINGDKLDNRVENLMWLTPSEHYKCSYAETALGKPHYYQRRLTDEQVLYILENPDGLLQVKLGKKLGVSTTTIWRIVKREIYADVK